MWARAFNAATIYMNEKGDDAVLPLFYSFEPCTWLATLSKCAMRPYAFAYVIREEVLRIAAFAARAMKVLNR